MEYENNQHPISNSVNLFINNIEQKETSNISKEVSLSRGEEDLIQKDILQEIEKSPRKRLFNRSSKFDEKPQNRSKDSKESSESGFVSNNKNFILKSTFYQGDNSIDYNKNHYFSSKKENNNNRFS